MAYSIYPNPASKYINIKAEETVENATVSIYNITGKLIYTEKQNELNEITIPVSKFAKGVYLIKITTKNGSSVKRINIK